MQSCPATLVPASLLLSFGVSRTIRSMVAAWRSFARRKSRRRKEVQDTNVAQLPPCCVQGEPIVSITSLRYTFWVMGA